jgi:hypothetical protein
VAATPPTTTVTPPPTKPKGPSNVYILTVALQKGNNNAADISAALNGNIPQVVSVTAVSDTKLLFVLDVSPLKDGDKPQDPKPIETLVTKAVHDLEANKIPLAVDYKYKQLPAGAGNAADVASKLSGVIPGVTNVISIGSAGLLFLLDETPDPRFPSKPRDIRGLKNEIDNIVDGLVMAETNFYMLPFPVGTGKNCDIANALAKQIPGVLNILTIGSTRLAFELDPRVDSANLRNRIGEYVNALAEPNTALAPNTETYTQRLFYDHDPITAAAIIHAAFPEVNASAIVPDTLVLSEAIPVNQSGKRDPLGDARRLIARIDQPKPQLSLETWSIQVSSSTKQDMERIGPEIERIAKEYNDVIANSTAKGWQYLADKLLPGANDLDDTFADYVTHQTYSIGQCCMESAAADQYANGKNGYALGYTSLFSPLPRNLAYWLIALAANKNPRDATEKLINTMETGNQAQATLQVVAPNGKATIAGTPRRSDGLCQERDYDGYKALADNKRGATLQLECARDALSEWLFAPSTSAIGPFRAAIADFLFQYKMLVQYPDEFQPFVLSQAAANLDNQLNPLAEAFTTDLQVFERRIKEEIESDKIIFGSKNVSYSASGIVSIKVVAGNQASVQTTTQNYFDATPPVRLGDIAAAIKSIGTGTTTSSGTSVAPSLPGFLTSNMTANEAVGALATIQALTRTPVSARIGKGLTLTATAYSLSGASGAEMDVAVESNENGAELATAATSSNLSSQTAQNDDYASRVSDHKVSTRVRVDSLNLFNLSTMESVLARGKSPWRPIDPWLEIPVLGEVVRVPRKPAITYHRSFIFIDALVVPTSADLANGALGGEDLVELSQAGGARALRRATSTAQLGAMDASKGSNVMGLIREYHKRIIRAINSERLDGNGNVASQQLPEFSNSLPSVE